MIALVILHIEYDPDHFLFTLLLQLHPPLTIDNDSHVYDTGIPSLTSGVTYVCKLVKKSD